MPSDFVQTVTATNLVSYYLLPLIHLNKFRFGSANFLESYVTAVGNVITVEVVSLHLLPDNSCREHYLYLSSTEGARGTAAVILFCLPPKWLADFQLFKEGQFSKFSHTAKSRIMRYSGLAVDSISGNGDDARILALSRSPVLQQVWEEELALPHGHLRGQELLEIPKPCNYREIE